MLIKVSAISKEHVGCKCIARQITLPSTLFGASLCPAQSICGGDFHKGPVAKTLHTQCGGLGFGPRSASYIPHAARKTEDPMCHN